MKLVKWTKDDRGYMLQLTKEEAIRLIQSLSNQLVADNPNTGRWEGNLKTGEYFSVSVGSAGAED
jgi:hypothetical protein